MKFLSSRRSWVYQSHLSVYSSNLRSRERRGEKAEREGKEEEGKGKREKGGEGCKRKQTTGKALRHSNQMLEKARILGDKSLRILLEISLAWFLDVSRKFENEVKSYNLIRVATKSPSSIPERFAGEPHSQQRTLSKMLLLWIALGTSHFRCYLVV